MNSQITSAGNILFHFDTHYGMRLHRNTLISSLKAVETAANFTAKNLFGKECRVELQSVEFSEGGLKEIAEIVCIVSELTSLINNGIQLLEKLTSKKAEPYIEQKRYPELIADVATAILGAPAKEIRTIFNDCIFTNASPEKVIK